MNAANAQIGDWLGLQSPATEGEILRIVEGRLAPSVIERLSALGLERSEIDAVVIPSRTLQHRRSRRNKLTVEESDRVLRVIRVLSLTESVYGGRERALAWLRKPNARLDGPSVAPPSNPAPESRIRMFSGGLHTESKSYTWGQSYTDVNSELDSHFSIDSYTALPQATEFTNADVRYFWVPLLGLPNVLSALVPGNLLAGHCIDPQSYIVFFFKDQKLFRISIRLFRGGTCSSYGWLTENLFSGQHRSASIHSPTGDTTISAHDDTNYSFIEAAQEDPAIVWTD